MGGLTDPQLHTMMILERTGSAMSLLGGLFIILTYSTSKLFHRPINRLVFFAAFGNVLVSIGLMMARMFVDSPDSFACQLQGFTSQWLGVADEFWTLAMAINVYLTFFHRFDAKRLRRMDTYYFFICFGIPLIPALTYLFVRNHDGQRVYGNAVLWCFVVLDWDVLLLTTLYGPAWVVIIVSSLIYIKCGRIIYEKPRQLKYFLSQKSVAIPLDQNSGSVKTTEISISSKIGEWRSVHPVESLQNESAADPLSAPAQHQYSISISSDKHAMQDCIVEEGPQLPTQSYDRNPEAISRATPYQPPPRSAVATGRRLNHEKNNAAWSYTKCALLFLIAMIVTWLPSSIYRLEGYVHPTTPSLSLAYASAFVLPLQGFWNCAIYVYTSWTAVKVYFSQLAERCPSSPIRLTRPTIVGPAKRRYQNDSTVQLASVQSSIKDSGSC